MPTQSEGRWKGFETDLMVRRRHARENARNLATATFKTAYGGASLFTGGGPGWIVNAISRLSVEVGGQYIAT